MPANNQIDRDAERSQALIDHLRSTRPAEYYAAYLKMVAKADAPQSGWLKRHGFTPTWVIMHIVLFTVWMWLIGHLQQGVGVALQYAPFYAFGAIGSQLVMVRLRRR